MEPVILGISPGSRTTAMVIRHNATIKDMQVRDIRNMVEGIALFRSWVLSAIEKYQVQAIAMKVVPSYLTTEVLEDLYSEIRQVACNTGIFLSCYDMEKLRKQSGGNHPNKVSLFRHLASQFPELELPYHTIHKPRNRRLFEAVACTMIE